MRSIDADELLTAFPYDDEPTVTKSSLRMTIKHMPTIGAEPIKHGHWIFSPKDAIEMMFTLPKCSECGAESSDAGNYCPYCGAKMDGERRKDDN